MASVARCDYHRREAAWTWAVAMTLPDHRGEVLTHVYLAKAVEMQSKTQRKTQLVQAYVDFECPRSDG
jgi:hypothetical protein